MIAQVSFNDREVRCRHSDGVVEAIAWCDLQQVLIRTTDTGPLMEDVYWILLGTRSECVVPQEAIGEPDLAERLYQLPGFDSEALSRAMCSTENREFLCWNRGGSAESPAGSSDYGDVVD